MFFGCSKSVFQEMEIVRNCTGIYLKKSHKEYRVCNNQDIEGYSDGELIKVTFEPISVCSEGGFYCEMAYDYEEDINLLEVKK